MTSQLGTNGTNDRPPFVCITRPHLTETNQLLRQACAARGIAFLPLEAGDLGQISLPQPVGDWLLYCAAVDAPSAYLEKLLYRPRTASFADPTFVCDQPGIALMNAGIPTARKVFLPASDPEQLARQIDWLGGYPIVVKRADSEGGKGIFRADERQAVNRLLDQHGQHLILEAFVPHSRAYRILVIGDRVVATTASSPGAGDFRTNSETAISLGPCDPPAEAEEAAVRAASILRLELGGVDVLERDDGALFVAEVNYPCYFAHQQEMTGTDIAGLMIDHLLAKHSFDL